MNCPRFGHLCVEEIADESPTEIPSILLASSKNQQKEAAVNVLGRILRFEESRQRMFLRLSLQLRMLPSTCTRTLSFLYRLEASRTNHPTIPRLHSRVIVFVPRVFGD